MTATKIGTPVLLGTYTNVGAAQSTAPVTASAAVPAGATIIVCADSDLRASTGQVDAYVTAVTDGANTYTKAEGGFLGQNIDAEIWTAENVTALALGTTITVQWSTGSDITATVLFCTGLSPSNALDQAVVAGETPAAGITLSTGFLGTPAELALVYWVARNAQGQPATSSPGWTSLAAFEGTNGVGHYVQVAWYITSSANPVTVAGTTPSPGTGWAGILATFRGVLVPTATGSIGGSAIAYPVAPVSLTADGALGGSSAGPADLGPYPPPILPVFPAGYAPLPADFAQWVRQSLGYCTDRIVFRAEATVGQVLDGGAWSPFGFGNILEDPFGGWSATGSGSQAPVSWLAPWTGWYRVTFRYVVSAVAAWLEAGVGVTGVNPSYEAEGCAVTASLPGGAGASVVVPLIGGADYVQVLARPSVQATTTAASGGLAACVEITPVQTDLRG